VAGAEVAFGDGAPALTHPGARQFDVLRWRVVEQPIGLVEQLDHPVEVGRERIAEGFSDGELRTRPGEYEPVERQVAPKATRSATAPPSELPQRTVAPVASATATTSSAYASSASGPAEASMSPLSPWPDRSSATTGNRSLTRACAFQTSLLPAPVDKTDCRSVAAAVGDSVGSVAVVVRDPLHGRCSRALLIKVVDGSGFLIAASDLSEFAGPKRPGAGAITRTAPAPARLPRTATLPLRRCYLTSCDFQR